MLSMPLPNVVFREASTLVYGHVVPQKKFKSIGCAHLKNFGFETRLNNAHGYVCKTLNILSKHIAIGTQLHEIYHVF